MNETLFRLGFATLLEHIALLHLGAYLAFTGHPRYDFHGWVSKTLIFGGGVLGGLYSALGWRARERMA